LAFLRFFIKVAHKPGLLVRTIAEWLVVRVTTSTNPDLILIQEQFEPTAFRLSCRPFRVGSDPAALLEADTHAAVLIDLFPRCVTVRKGR
jgi:hypothetical protein